MSYEAKLAEAQRIVEAHNTSIGPGQNNGTVNWETILGKIHQIGGTSEDNLKSMTWEDLQECGLPKLLARRIANEVFRQKDAPAAPKPYIGPMTEMRVATLNATALLGIFDPEGEVNPAVTKRLMELSSGKPFIVYELDGTVNVPASVDLLKEIRRGEPAREQVTVGHTVVRPRPANYVPRELVNENPLFPKTALRSDDSCPISGRSYKGIALRPRQVMYLALQTKELTIQGKEDIHNMLDKLDGRTEEQMNLFLSTRYPKAVLLLNEMELAGKNLPLRVTTGSAEDNRKEDPFGKHVRT